MKFKIGDSVRVIETPKEFEPELLNQTGTVIALPDNPKRTRKGYYRRGMDGYSVTFKPPVRYSGGSITTTVFMDFELVKS